MLRLECLTEVSRLSHKPNAFSPAFPDLPVKRATTVLSCTVYYVLCYAVRYAVHESRPHVMHLPVFGDG